MAEHADDAVAVEPALVDWERVCEMHMHPLKLEILRGIAATGETSPVRIAERCVGDVPDDERAAAVKRIMGNVSHHVRTLLKEGLIEPTRTIPRRGALEHMYRIASDIRASG